jgi:hypothetical protein
MMLHELKTSSTLRSPGLMCTVVASLMAFACNGEDDGPGSGSGGRDAGGPGSADAGPADLGTADMGTPMIEPFFAAGLRNRDPAGGTEASFLRVYDSLDGVDEISADEQAEEFAGQQRFIKIRDAMLLESAEQGNPIITRYDVTPDGLEAGDTLSLVNQGFPTAGRTIQVADRKAYNINFEDLRVASFDPVTMQLLTPDTFQLPADELNQGFTQNGIAHAQVGDLLYVSLAFANLFAQVPTVADGITVYIIDTTTDEVTRIDDDRCSHVNGTAQTENGDVYFLGDNGFNVLRPMEQACIVRIRAGEESFDPDYVWRPRSELGGRGASDLIAIEGDLALTFPLYPERLDPNDPASVLRDPVRRPWIIDLENRTATELDEVPFTRGAPIYRIEGQLWIGVDPSMPAPFTETIVYSIDPSELSATRELRAEGQLISLLEFP